MVCNGRRLYSQSPTTHHTILTIEGRDPFVCRKNRCLYTLNNYNVHTYEFLNVLKTILLLFNPHHTYLLTPWSRVLLEKLTGFAASQEIPRI
jgi:hypothetical protein